MHADLRRADLEEIVDLVFDHSTELAPDPDDDEENARPVAWYWRERVELEIDPAHQVQLLTQLFRHAGPLRWRFDAEQLEQGFWFMFSGSGRDYFAGPLADERVASSARCACLAAVYDLYAELFVHDCLDEIPYMLWDLLLDQWWNGDAEDYVLPDDVGDTIFHTLVRILALPSPECQRGALHGLGHLRYPGTSDAVAAFLAANPDLHGELRAYAERVRAGESVL